MVRPHGICGSTGTRFASTYYIAHIAHFKRSDDQQAPQRGASTFVVFQPVSTLVITVAAPTLEVYHVVLNCDYLTGLWGRSESPKTSVCIGACSFFQRL